MWRDQEGNRGNIYWIQRYCRCTPNLHVGGVIGHGIGHMFIGESGHVSEVV